ncbi:Redox-sensing transcriptional repressor Rex 1 [subsurface metagenome]
MKESGAFVKENRIDIAIIAVPKDAADDISANLIQNGIKGILNFAPLDLNVQEGFPVENVHIIDKILALSFMIS